MQKLKVTSRRLNHLSTWCCVLHRSCVWFCLTLPVSLTELTAAQRCSNVLQLQNIRLWLFSAWSLAHKCIIQLTSSSWGERIPIHIFFSPASAISVAASSVWICKHQHTRASIPTQSKQSRTREKHANSSHLLRTYSSFWRYDVVSNVDLIAVVGHRIAASGPGRNHCRWLRSGKAGPADGQKTGARLYPAKGAVLQSAAAVCRGSGRWVTVDAAHDQGESGESGGMSRTGARRLLLGESFVDVSVKHAWV